MEILKRERGKVIIEMSSEEIDLFEAVIDTAATFEKNLQDQDDLEEIYQQFKNLMCPYEQGGVR